jgi:hypothetical protein
MTGTPGGDAENLAPRSGDATAEKEDTASVDIAAAEVQIRIVYQRKDVL